jgi:hypothetical protein
VALFQAGPMPKDNSEESSGPWWTTPWGRCRLAVEVKAMGERFPGFELQQSEDEGALWTGVLRSTFDRRRRYVVTVAYPSDFPVDAPVVNIVKPHLVTDRHLLGDSRPCLYRPADGARSGYDAGTTTAATFVAWTALWIHAYETYKSTGEWPGREE